MKTPKQTLAILASTAAFAGGAFAVAAPAASASETEPGTIAEIVSGVPGSGDIADDLEKMLHVDSTAVLNALEAVAKDHSVENVTKLLDTLGVHGL